jgi:hypothetical protein
MTNLIDYLIQESKSSTSNEEFVTSLVSQIKTSSPRSADLEYAVGGLRSAVARYLEAEDAEVERCCFCGKSRKDVRTLLVSAESTICDESVVAALHAMSHQPGQFHLRIAFFFFRAVASLGRLLSLGTGRQKREQ